MGKFTQSWEPKQGNYWANIFSEDWKIKQLHRLHKHCSRTENFKSKISNCFNTFKSYFTANVSASQKQAKKYKYQAALQSILSTTTTKIFNNIQCLFNFAIHFLHKIRSAKPWCRPAKAANTAVTTSSRHHTVRALWSTPRWDLTLSTTRLRYTRVVTVVSSSSSDSEPAPVAPP